MKSYKVMLITGATSGIGKALAEHYYKKNYKLILVGGTKEKVDKLSKKFQLEGQQKWGHGLLIPNDDYNKKIDGVSLSSLIEQWIGGESPIFIRY